MSAPAACPNCGVLASPGHHFCADCGQKIELHRLTLGEIASELLHLLFHFDRSVLSLDRQLLLRPGIVAAEYIDGHRKRYFGPFSFLIVTVALTSAEIALSGFQTVTTDVPNAAAGYLQHHVNLLFFVQTPILAGMSRLMALEDRFNYAEHLVLASYTSGIHVLSYAMLVVPVWFLLSAHPAVLRQLYFIYLPLWPLYFGFASSQFLRKPRWLAFSKGVVALLVSQGILLTLVSVAAKLALQR